MPGDGPMHRGLLLFVAIIATILLVSGSTTNAHKPITSKYMYHQDVYPIFLAQCGGCHAPGAVAPMSLLSYGDAYPWAQSIKEELVNLTMPPWQPEDGFGRFKHGGSLTAQQLDIVVEWANGGTPEGVPVDHPVANVKPSWPLGEPTAIFEMPEIFTLTADVHEATRYFVIPSGFERETLIRAVDFRPGAPAIVRSAILFVDTSNKAAVYDAADPNPGFGVEDVSEFDTEQILAAWLPGQEAIALDGAAYAVPADADLVLRVTYKKTWTYEGLAVEDRSAVALYVATRDVPKVETMTLQSPSRLNTGNDQVVTFTTDLARDVDLLAILPNLATDALAVQIEALTRDGRRTPIVRLASPRPQWRTRYWLEEPLTLARGTTLEVQAIFKSDQTDGNLPVRFTLDLVSTPPVNVAKIGQAPVERNP
ncbi:MAG: hypothetical protein CL489_01380 [Acidobacteria bacterium]|nr:hypothetical protein [Acidobacteriota bacterium]